MSSQVREVLRPGRTVLTVYSVHWHWLTTNSATLRRLSLAEQCHTQNFYLRCFKSDFDAVKGKFGLLTE